MTTASDKWILKSKTFWGVALVTIPALMSAFGVSIPDDVVGEIDSIVKMALTLAGSVLALYGRFTATKDVTLLP